MKRIVFLVSLLFLLFLKFTPFQKTATNGVHQHFLKSKNRYLKSFNQKAVKPLPSWMQDQIREDIEPFKGRKITQDALNKTYALSKNENLVLRYRIVDNKVFRNKEQKDIQWQPFDFFQEALFSLCQIKKMPNLECIVNHADGTFSPFYKTETFDMQAPIFGWARLKTVPYLILIPDYSSLSTLWFNQLHQFTKSKKFKEKMVFWDEKENRAFWRGSSTEQNVRFKLAQMSLAHPQIIDAGLICASEKDQYLMKPYASYRRSFNVQIFACT